MDICVSISKVITIYIPIMYSNVDRVTATSELEQFPVLAVLNIITPKMLP